MHFMVEGIPKQAAMTDEILALIPAETARGQELDAQGLRQAFHMAADSSKIWQVFDAESEEEVQQALRSLPLYHVTAYTIIPLVEHH